MQLRQGFPLALPHRGWGTLTAGLFNMPGWSDSNSGMRKENNPLPYVILRSTCRLNRACMVVTDHEPDRLPAFPDSQSQFKIGVTLALRLSFAFSGVKLWPRPMVVAMIPDDAMALSIELQKAALMPPV
jgi:hypothetical protein